MATRLYTPPGSAAPVAPAFSAEWDVTTDALRRALVTAKTNQATDDTLSTNDSTATSDRDALLFQFVSPAIAAGPIGGTGRGQFYAFEISSAYNLRAQMLIKVVSNDGGTLRGTLYAGDLATLTGDPSGEWSTANYFNRAFPRASPVALSPVTALANDRVVVEVGYRKHSTASVTGTMVISDATGVGDLPTGDTSDTLGTPSRATWVEFSEDLFATRIFTTVRSFILE